MDRLAGTDFNDNWRYAFIARLRDVPGYDDPALIEESRRAFDAKAAIVDDQLAQTTAYIAGAAFVVGCPLLVIPAIAGT